MRVHLVFVPDEDIAPEHTLDFDMPSAPQVGDYLTIVRPGQSGSATLIVRHVFWTLDCPEAAAAHRADSAAVGAVDSVTVECEFTVGPYASEEHHGIAAVPLCGK